MKNMSTQRFQHVRFCKIKLSEDFFFGAFRYRKARYFLGRAVLDGRGIVVMPWTKVRSTRPFGKAKPGLLPLELQTLTGEGPIVDVIRPLNVLTRPPQKVEGRDITSETIGGSELTPGS